MSATVAEPQATEMSIPAAGVVLHASVTVPADACGVVLFAQRDPFLAAELNRRRFATVLADLLTRTEADMDERTSAYRFDMMRLTKRVAGIVDWARTYDPLRSLPVGLFGSGTGAAAALDAAARRPEIVSAVVSRSGRPDLASDLELILAPTLFIVGGAEIPILALNMEALQRLHCRKRVHTIAGETEAVAKPAAEWFAEFVTR